MVDQFGKFAAAVRKQFEEMAKGPLFVVNSDRDVIWETYLKSFPEGSNPKFRERTEHDCSCCRHFIRDIGNIVAIKSGKLISVWDVEGLPPHYQAVADAMSEYVKSLEVDNVYLTTERRHGTSSNVEITDTGTLTWSHFAVVVPPAFVSPLAVERQGEARTTYGVLYRGLTELKPEALATVAGLIEENAIYRGQEFKTQVAEFQRLQTAFLKVKKENERKLFAWTMLDSPFARFRNTVIGTLVQDLSEGVEEERAVKAYESKVAPTNYKRPTALITKGMVEQAMTTIKELDLESALERRHARLSDVSVNSVLFVDNSVKGKMKGGIESLLHEEVKPVAFDPKKAEEISMDEFITTVLPKSKSVSLYLGNELLNNFVSLTAPVHPDSKRLFKWDNDFAWSYDGNVADTIKEKVKRAGGRVENVNMRVSLAWHNYDDLDLHVEEPISKVRWNHIYYGNMSGKLDVDANRGGGRPGNGTREPVENVRWVERLVDGEYRIWVNQYARMESRDVGFEAEIEYEGQLIQLKCAKSPVSNQEVGTIIVKNGKVVKFDMAKGMEGGSISQEKWGIKTLEPIKVNSIVISPNYWDENQVGNKHWFFLLDGCKNPNPTRGIYNEFLHSRLEKHRKVFEVLGEKTKVPFADEQLSGVGFSSTRKDRVVVLAVGPRFNKAYTIAFGKEDGNGSVRTSVESAAAV